MNDYYSKVGIPYIQAQEELVTGLMDTIETEIRDVATISAADNFQDFVSAFEKAESEKFKSVNFLLVVNYNITSCINYNCWWINQIN